MIEDARLEILGVTKSYPDYYGFNGKLDPARFQHTDVTIQVKGKRVDLYNILGLGEYWMHHDKGWQAVTVWDASPDQYLPKDCAVTVLDRLQALGYLDEIQVAFIGSLGKSSHGGCGDDR